MESFVDNKSSNVSISELMEEIIQILQTTNPRAVRLVYAYLMGLTDGKKDEVVFQN